MNYRERAIEYINIQNKISNSIWIDNKTGRPEGSYTYAPFNGSVTDSGMFTRYHAYEGPNEGVNNENLIKKLIFWFIKQDKEQGDKTTILNCHNFLDKVCYEFPEILNEENNSLEMRIRALAQCFKYYKTNYDRLVEENADRASDYKFENF